MWGKVVIIIKQFKEKLSIRVKLWSWVNQFSLVAQLYPTLCDPMDCSTPGSPVHHELPEFAETHVHWVGDTIQLSHPLSSSSLLSSIFPNIRAFSSESTLCIRWPNYQSFSVSMSLLNEYSGLISFRIDWFDLFVVQGSLKSSPVPQLKSFDSLALI